MSPVRGASSLATGGACSPRPIRPHRRSSSRPRPPACAGSPTLERRAVPEVLVVRDGGTEPARPRVDRRRTAVRLGAWRGAIWPPTRRPAPCRCSRGSDARIGARRGAGAAQRAVCDVGRVLRDTTVVAARPHRPWVLRRWRLAGLERLAGRLDRFGAADEPPAQPARRPWAGNRSSTIGASWLIDPAAHGGHREFDLAMMRLFGGFGDECYSAYDERTRWRPVGRERVALHQIAPLVVHAVKFGAWLRRCRGSGDRDVHLTNPGFISIGHPAAVSGSQPVPLDSACPVTSRRPNHAGAPKAVAASTDGNSTSTMHSPASVPAKMSTSAVRSPTDTVAGLLQAPFAGVLPEILGLGEVEGDLDLGAIELVAARLDRQPGAVRGDAAAHRHAGVDHDSPDVRSVPTPSVSPGGGRSATPLCARSLGCHLPVSRRCRAIGRVRLTDHARDVFVPQRPSVGFRRPSAASAHMALALAKFAYVTVVVENERQP